MVAAAMAVMVLAFVAFYLAASRHGGLSPNP